MTQSVDSLEVDGSAIAQRLADVHERIAAAARRAGRDPAQITLVGVSKKVSAESMVAAVAAGLDHLGESYIQEAREKLPRVAQLLADGGIPAPRWHFIGQLQRNKARHAVRLFDCLESVDREKLARTLEPLAAEADRRLDVLLQVNISGEAQKGGVTPDALPRLLESCAALPHLRVVGLMGVPALASDPESSRPGFARLRALFEDSRSLPGGGELRELSMGMSGDFEVAIEEGASVVRVGTAIFGPREG